MLHSIPPGGATQNAIRVAQWMLSSKPGSTSYIGAVGSDDFGLQLRTSAEGDGVAVHYLELEEHATGTCAVLVHAKDRSLIANLAAANHYKIDHLKSDEIKAVLAAAQYCYSAGFFLTVSPPSLMHVAEHCLENKKIFCMNLAAPFICQFFTAPLMAALPYADFLFGNESEAKALGETLKLADTSVESVAKHLSLLESKKSSPRTVIITQGSESTCVAREGKTQTFSVPKLDSSLIVDVNGAGDAFVGGFLAAHSTGKEVAQCVEAGHYAARCIIQVSGAALKSKSTFQL